MLNKSFEMLIDYYFWGDCLIRNREKLINLLFDREDEY